MPDESRFSVEEEKQDPLLPLQVMFRPVEAFRKLRTRPILASLMYLLVTGMITSILGGLLAVFLGVNYLNPSNCGGSAQIFAHWLVFVWLNLEEWGLQLILFILGNQAGYLILALLSAPTLAWITSLASESSFRELVAPTMSAICYGMTPGVLFGWIPNPIFLFGLMALVYQAVAFWTMLELTKGRAAALMLVWLVLFGLLQDLAASLFGLILQV
ncbi:MAG: hypothetical protein ACFFCK_11145 [Promethearchaeota archaeon]